MSDTERAIISTLAFFDLFDHAPTSYELYSVLTVSSFVPWSTFQAALFALEQGGCIKNDTAFWFFSGRNMLIDTRRARQEWIARKMKRAIRAARLLRYVPFVDAVCACNRLAAGHPHEESDIDFFIIIRAGRLWFARFLVTALLQAAGLRRHDTSISDRVCLSFYITSDAASLQSVSLAGDDIYLRYWIVSLLPLWSDEGVMEKFWEENAWAREVLYASPMPIPFLRKRTVVFIWMVERLLRGRLGARLEMYARAWQKKRIEQKMASHAIPNAVVISDTMLKFHENDRREWYRAAWEERKKQYA